MRRKLSIITVADRAKDPQSFESEQELMDSEMHCWEEFFLKKRAGEFKPVEISRLKNPTLEKVEKEIGEGNALDLHIVIFIGHGGISAVNSGYILKDYDAHQFRFEKLYSSAIRQLIIMDACRTYTDGCLENSQKKIEGNKGRLIFYSVSPGEISRPTDFLYGINEYLNSGKYLESNKSVITVRDFYTLIREHFAKKQDIFKNLGTPALDGDKDFDMPFLYLSR